MDVKRDLEYESKPNVVTGSEYQRLLLDARGRQLERNAENVRRIAQVYQLAIERIVAKVEALPDTVDRNGTGWLAAQFNLIRDIDQEIATLRRDYADMLDLSMLDNAQVAADREAQVAELVGVRPTSNLLPVLERTMEVAGNTFSVQFGRLAQDAVQVVQARYYSDGITLSDRMGVLSASTRQTIEKAVETGLADGSSARQIAKEVQSALIASNEDTPMYRAMRIARTETNTAFREAAVMATVEPGGETLKPYISAIGWRLSLSHKEFDICDAYAADDTGLGAGNYLPGAVPVSHPHCLCVPVSILKQLPDEQFVRKAPEVDKIPPAQIRYAANQGDPVAQRLLVQS